ncbi:MAG: RNA polymerase sigma factor [Flavobacteriaceae bacterium]|nr:RNA polymerase sigma factor [Flavobacteriaceae bacterium]
MNTLTDNQLMLAVKAGEVDRLGQLYERYKVWIYNFFFQSSHDVQLSEDLVQNVFMRILKYKHTYTEDSKFVTWMFQIARNVNHDHFRKNKKHMNNADLEGVTYKTESGRGVEESMELDESKRLLREAIQQLSIEKREVIVLSKLKELKYREVGAILGCSEEAARTKAHRALKELKSVYMELQNR